MAVAAASLANLRPPFPPGFHPRTRKSLEIDRSIRAIRRLCPKAVAFCTEVLNDPDADTALRVKVALAIIEKAIPGNQAFLQSGDDLVTRVTIEIQRHGAPLGESDSVTIEATPEHTLSFTTIAAGHGNDD